MKFSLLVVKDAFLAANRIANDKGSAKWAYALAKNKGIMKNEIDGIMAVENRILAVQDKFMKYCKANATRNEKGEPKVENGMYAGIDYKNDPELKKIVDERQKEINALDDLLKNEVELNFHKVDFEEVPEKIAPIDFEKLSIFINEPKK